MKGYKKVRLYKNGKMKRFYVHRLVAECFVSGKTRYSKEVDHKNNIRYCNFYTNLKWVTRKQNMKDCHKRNPHIVEKLLSNRFTSDVIAV